MSFFANPEAHSAIEVNVVEKDEDSKYERSSDDVGVDLLSYHEHNAGRLVVDPEEAKVEFGERIAKKLKLSADGSKVLWPQPTDDPEDPQNWSDGRKNLQLFVITLAAAVPDFDSGIGIASIFALAAQYDTTPTVINDLTSNWSIFLLGWGSIFAVILMRRYGRLPILFWSQVLALGFLVGCTFAPNLKTFAAMRCLTAFFGTCPHGLYVVTDMFPFHLQARKLNIWTMGFLLSPFLSPFLFGFLVARASWRWTYGIGAIYGATVVFFILFFGEETMYDRTLPDPRPIKRPASRLRYRIETLIGLTGARMARHRAGWRDAALACLNIIWRPQLVGILLFEAMVFGFSIGINTTNAVFLGESKPVGLGFSQYAIAGAYGTPIVAVLIGEVLGRYFNDWVMNVCVKRNKGVFEAEMRLWTCYVAVPLYICGFLLLGGTFQNHLGTGALVMGWGIAEVAVMICTVAVYAYCNDCFPTRQGEVSALINWARTMGGFSVAYFQVPWAERNGALQTFGVEAAIVSALFLLVVPALQLHGSRLRVSIT
ncbi:MFS general substrate transporter [Laetiporus sulphureus 93-53]|uniref:MFS general substrate transporter n=1 Tax=Laetiporus sulphureus 93-53 TaxID=1314785 RepID=A0A165GMW3_9APHY|nr:MFS general substrate transporter [Laetiporus sulphureus 93-53]KZT10568.1 MFS general substrate transporter [Laetiporus sulphureus 93-53]